MKRAELKAVLMKLLPHQMVGGIRIVPIVWGPPGIGKRALVAEVAQELEARLVEVTILPQTELQDPLGVPIPTGQGVRRVPPAWALKVQEAPRVILFFNGLTKAPRNIQRAAIHVLSEGRLKEAAREFIAFLRGKQQGSP